MTDLGMFSRQLEGLRRLIYRPNGLLLVTGPTGSGKTTTLYSILRDLSTPEVNITTIEDPIEMLIDDFNQVGVNPVVGLKFSQALRTILRQDPDIVMLGEIRDGETARMAVQAALTGHLVLSTVHTNDAAGAITRLQDLGVPNYLLSATLTGVLAQRLVRRICSRCKVRMQLTTTQCRELGIPLQEGEPPKLSIYQGAGCPHCRETGYRGRSGAYELLPISVEIREKVADGSPLVELRRAALADGMMSLRESAIKKMAQGITSFEEVLRVTASIEN
jgi:general secretion pathway protein E